MNGGFLQEVSYVNQECEISISLFFVVKSRFDAPVFMPCASWQYIINATSATAAH